MASSIDLSVSGIPIEELEAQLDQVRLRANDEIRKLGQNFQAQTHFESWIDSAWNDGWGRKGGKFEADETACGTLQVTDGKYHDENHDNDDDDKHNGGKVAHENMRLRYKKGEYGVGKSRKAVAPGESDNHTVHHEVAQMVDHNYSPQDVKAAFDFQGFVVFRNFHSTEDCGDMMGRMEELAGKWDPDAPYVAKSGNVKREDSTFRTDEGQVKTQGSSEYFMDSSDRTHFFNEAGALNENSDDKADDKAEKPKRLQPQYYKSGKSKMMALNKVGHGMHVDDALFREYCLSKKIKAVTDMLGWKTPVVPQSMYILKQPVLEAEEDCLNDSLGCEAKEAPKYSNPRAGSEVTAHQDSTFLYTEPRQSCLGLWLALQPATLMNGCLWVRPKSHFEGLSRAFRRNDEYYQAPEFRKAKEEVVEREKDTSQMIFDNLTPEKTATAPWEGKLPDGCWPPPCDGMFDAGYVPVEVNAGDLLVFSGTTDHLSLPNYTRESRHTFQLHLVEGPKSGVEWSKRNWLQYPEGKGFVEL